MPQSVMSIGDLFHFRRDISCNVGIIPALKPRDRLIGPKLVGPKSYSLDSARG
jgi:hypothetical protein